MITKILEFKEELKKNFMNRKKLTSKIWNVFFLAYIELYIIAPLYIIYFIIEFIIIYILKW